MTPIDIAALVLVLAFMVSIFGGDEVMLGCFFLISILCALYLIMRLGSWVFS